MNLIDSILLITLPIWNLAVCMMYIADKSRAKNKQWRYRERTLLLGALCFGGLGAYIGMHAVRHKTQHTSFRIVVPLGLIILIVATAAYLYWRLSAMI